MLPYFIFITIISILIILSVNTRNKRFKKIFLVLVLLLLVFFGGFRETAGIDTINYTAAFNVVNVLGNGFMESLTILDMEVGFIFLISLIKSFGFTSVQTLFSLTIVFNYILYYLSFRRFTTNFEFAIFLMIIFHFLGRDMGLMRQSIATSITVYSIGFIIDKKPLSFFMLIIIASLFHVSALIFLPAYLTRYINYSKTDIYLFLVLTFLFSNIPINFINDLSLKITGLNLPYYNDLVDGGPVSIISFIRRLIPVGIIFLFYDKISIRIKVSPIIMKLYLFGISVAFLFRIEVLFTRLFVYYLILEVIIFAYLIIAIDSIKNKFLNYIIVLSSGIVFLLVNLLLDNSMNYIPYDNVIINWIKEAFVL